MFRKLSSGFGTVCITIDAKESLSESNGSNQTKLNTEEEEVRICPLTPGQRCRSHGGERRRRKKKEEEEEEEEEDMNSNNKRNKLEVQF